MGGRGGCDMVGVGVGVTVWEGKVEGFDGGRKCE